MLLGPLGPAFSGITNPHERDRHKAIVECVEHLGEADYRILEYDIRAFPAYYRELIACHPERGAWTRRYCDSFMPGARSTPEG